MNGAMGLDGHRFVKSYNGRIRELLRRHGLPAWAPIRHYLTAHGRRALLFAGELVLTIEELERHRDSTSA